MDSFRRRQTILSLLKERGQLTVEALAVQLGVSPNTIRNDFNALAGQGLVRRLHGGAAFVDPYDSNGSTVSRTFANRVANRREAKRTIARWAAELVEDGDSILLDASSTVYYFAEQLKDRRDLTVVTSGIETGRLLAQEPSNTVFLLGGQLRTDGVLVSNPLGGSLLRDLHIETAFFSCSGFTPDAGLTEWNLPEAQLKREMLASAGSVVALIDSGKFGRVDLVPFANTAQVGRIFTDGDLSPSWTDELQRTCVELTICHQHGVTRLNRCDQADRHYVIGFANLGEQQAFAVEVRRGLERAAKAANVDLIIADNHMDPSVALQAAELLIGAQPDLIIEYQIDERQNFVLMDRFRRAGLPVIAVDIPMIGATYFGVDNYRAGRLAGEPLGRWIKDNWEGHLDRVIMLEEPRAGATPAARMYGQLDAINEILGPMPPEQVVHIDCGNTYEQTEREMSEALVRMPEAHRLAVLCFNDDAALGALAAARRLGREDDLIMASQGADRKVREEMNRPGSRIIGACAYFPEQYGEALIALALRILRGEAVQPAIHIDHVFIQSIEEVKIA